MPTSSRCPTSGQHPTSGPRQTPVPTSSRPHTPMPTSSRRHTPMPTSSRRNTPLHDHTMEEASQTTDEMSLDTAYDIGSMAHDDAGLSHIDDMRFMPTPGLPPLVLSPLRACIPSSSRHRYPPPHQSLHTLRIDREGRNEHGHILLTMGPDVVL